ncbi:hypothetical protein AN1V17_11960 [Vallitalea sediminicola]
MTELLASKIEAKKILEDIKEHPDHFKDYNLEAIYKHLLNMEITYLTGCDVKRMENIPRKYLKQIRIFIKNILQYCVDRQVVK